MNDFGAIDRDIQTDGCTAASHNAPHFGGGAHKTIKIVETFNERCLADDRSCYVPGDVAKRLEDRLNLTKIDDLQNRTSRADYWPVSSLATRTHIL